MRMMLSWAAVVLACPGLAKAEGQPPQIKPGARVQVFAPGGVLGYSERNDARRSMFGTVEAITAKDVTIREGERSRTVRLSDISRLNIVTGKRRNVMGGALVGALIVGVGLPVLAVTTGTWVRASDGRGSVPFLGVVAAGAAVGGGVGALVKTDRWERMPMPVSVVSVGHGPARLSVHRIRRGAAVGVTFAF